MLPIVSTLLLAGCLWLGGRPLGTALVALGVLVQIVLVARLGRASIGGVGGHAEWVRDVSRRPRLRRDPWWLVAFLLVVVGAIVSLF